MLDLWTASGYGCFTASRERYGSISRPFLLSWPGISGICASNRRRVLWPLVGEYAFSEERLQDTAGIRLPKLAD
jgi:hypothetical protein